jgi:hypothetical protein
MAPEQEYQWLGEFIINTDERNVGVGGGLSQVHKGQQDPVQG